MMASQNNQGLNERDKTTRVYLDKIGIKYNKYTPILSKETLTILYIICALNSVLLNINENYFQLSWRYEGTQPLMGSMTLELQSMQTTLANLHVHRPAFNSDA